MLVHSTSSCIDTRTNNAAKKYIDSGKGTGEATGGSDWKKYMHPKYQRRIFFPELWSEEELKNWGEGV